MNPEPENLIFFGPWPTQADPNLDEALNWENLSPFQLNGEPSSARWQHWSQMKVVSFCLENIPASIIKTHSFSSGTSAATWWMMATHWNLTFIGKVSVGQMSLEKRCAGTKQNTQNGRALIFVTSNWEFNQSCSIHQSFFLLLDLIRRMRFFSGRSLMTRSLFLRTRGLPFQEKSRISQK